MHRSVCSLHFASRKWWPLKYEINDVQFCAHTATIFWVIRCINKTILTSRLIKNNVSRSGEDIKDCNIFRDFWLAAFPPRLINSCPHWLDFHWREKSRFDWPIRLSVGAFVRTDRFAGRCRAPSSMFCLRWAPDSNILSSYTFQVRTFNVIWLNINRTWRHEAEDILSEPTEIAWKA